MLALHHIISVLPSNPTHIIVAFSGGVDSHVLLHLLALHPLFKSKITAVYINHGLQVEAEGWALHCKTIATHLGVAFKSIQVDAQKKAAQSQEEVARNVRYKALKSLVNQGDILLMAQHREDQLETVLLQLFRGAGVQGLSGMPINTLFGKGRMIRPLLDISKQAIIEYANFHQLHWIDDPSNQSNDFDRNFLRNQILPQLKQRWLGLDKTVARTARHCVNSHLASQLLAENLLIKCYNDQDQTICCENLLRLPHYQQQLVLRQWLAQYSLRMPSEVQIDKILTSIVLAKPSANPEIKLQQYSLRRYRAKLYCDEFQSDTLIEQVWANDSQQIAYKDKHYLQRIDSSEGISRQQWDQAEITVKFRSGSEKVALPYRQGHHSLKKLFQEQGVPPWKRQCMPLIYLDNQLAAIGDLWVTTDFYQKKQSACYQFKLDT